MYCNALEKINNESRAAVTMQVVDSEIEFKIKDSNKRDSSSSEEAVNTSDELMDVDFSEKLIAKCAAEAAVTSHGRK